MNAKPRHLRLLFYSCTILLLMSCAIPGVLKGSSKTTATLQTGVSGSAGIGGQKTTQESGIKVKNILQDPSTGLADLTGYHASLTRDVTGKLDGKPYDRHTQLDLTRLNDPAQYDFTNKMNGTDTQDFLLRIMARDSAFYRWMQSNPECQGSISAPADGEVVEPASFLLPIDGATRLGAETINRIPSMHYQFDQTGLPVTKDSGPVSGDVWIADQGGYVVKYTLSSPQPEKLTGKDLEVGQKWNYELDKVNTVESIDLPAGCLPVPVGLPTTADAKDMQQISGRLSYTSASSGRQVLDLYYRELPGLGWIPHSPLLTGDITLPYLNYFEKADQRLTLYINEGEKSGVDVDLLITIPELVPAAPQVEVTETPSGTPSPAATINPAESGLPDDIPLYPGATDLYKTGEMVMFTTIDAPVDVGKYYGEEMVTRGWKLFNETNITDMIMQIWEKSDKNATITVVVQDGNTTVVIALPK